jgi:ribosome maturation factor RimP
MSSPVPNLTATSHPNDHLIQLISPWVMALGYQIIHLEIQSHRQKVLRIFIDYMEPSSEKTIGIEDCVKVSRALDEQLDQIPEVEAAFHGAYELEVSSPGVDRPLRLAHDFERFAGREVRIHVYRPLTAQELDDPKYQEKNPKQKNFFGTLRGLHEGKVLLALTQPKAASPKKAKKKSKADLKAELTTNSAEGIQVKIPLPLISKANLEPQFDFEGSDERE